MNDPLFRKRNGPSPQREMTRCIPHGRRPPRALTVNDVIQYSPIQQQIQRPLQPPLFSQHYTVQFAIDSRRSKCQKHVQTHNYRTPTMAKRVHSTGRMDDRRGAQQFSKPARWIDVRNLLVRTLLFTFGARKLCLPKASDCVCRLHLIELHACMNL